MRAAPLALSGAQQAELARMAASAALPRRRIVQARALLWAADGVANEEIARRAGVDSDTVRRWRKRFAASGTASVGMIAKGRGRKPSLPPGTVAEVLRLTRTEPPPDGSAHWSTRSMAARVGVGKDTVARIWADHRLTPRKTDQQLPAGKADHRLTPRKGETAGEIEAHSPREPAGAVPTMADVARRAEVSVSTVSYAMTGARPISEATRERIRWAMLDLGYTPNALARGLRGKRSRILAVLFPKNERDIDLGSMEYILGASDHAQRRGYHLLLWTTGVEALDDLAGLARQGLVDGALLMEVRLDDPRIGVLRDSRLTFTMLGRNAEPGDLDYVDTNFDQCARLAVEHLAGLGHRNLGFVHQNAETIESGRGNAIRLRDCMVRAARDAGVTLTALTCRRSIAGGRQAFAELIAADPRATAVIAFNEQATPGLMAAAAESGRRVPRDFSVLAVDMPAQGALMTAPTVTTVGPGAAAMGKAAVEMLIRRIEGEKPDGATQVLFDGELTVRASCGPRRR
ncbi:substrate-binding domain-containing protein [Actinoplanes sp. NPDC051411]|uniref:substrate-binding domain-containing protein n=1 Tax=Actinoplanes sp. NPDC051411 TaxID=3155522 RepID=UPI0034471F6B